MSLHVLENQGKSWQEGIGSKRGPATEETTAKPTVSLQFVILPENEYQTWTSVAFGVLDCVSFKITLSGKSLCLGKPCR